MMQTQNKASFSIISKNKIYTTVSFFITLGAIAFFLYYLWTYPNLYNIDFGGQIGSAALFINHGFHGWSPEWFLGIINNLFYPPLQDSIVAGIHFLTGLDMLFSFLVYVSFLIIGYFGVTWLISTKFVYTKSKILYFLCMTIFFFINKFPTVTYFQGLGVIDIFFTGLITQILGGLFLQLTLLELLTKKRIIPLIIYSILGFLSHIVMGPVIILIVTLFLISQKKKYILSYILSVISITSFFWIPFLWYRGEMITSNIINPMPHFIILILVGGLFFIRKNILLLAICLSGILMLLPGEIAALSQFLGWKLVLPDFHYYRFTSIATLLAIFSLGILSDILQRLHFKNKKIFSKHFKNIIYYGVLGAIFIFPLGKRGDFWEEMGSYLDKSVIPVAQDLQALSGLDKNSRIFTIDSRRSIGFSIDSLDQYMGYQNLYIKGLFRESHYSNELLSSYLANILSPQTSVLPNRFLGDPLYKNYTFFWDKFIDNYAIGYVLVAPLDKIQYLSPLKRQFLGRILEEGTSEITMTKIGTIPLNHMEYTLYKIEPRPTSTLQNTITSVIHAIPKVYTINTHENVFSKVLMNSYVYHDKTPQTIFTPDIIYAQNSPKFSLGMPTNGTASREKITTNTYKITTTGLGPLQLHIKINSLPGIHFYDQNKKKIDPVILPFGRYITVHGGTTIYMKYTKTDIMYASYTISILSLIVSIWFWKRKKYL